jgi:Flp pilus assembly pilin Flp
MTESRRSNVLSADETTRPAGKAGQGLVEYALILLLVAIAIVGAVGAFGGSLQASYTAIANAVVSS